MASGCIAAGDPSAPYRHAELAIWDGLEHSRDVHPRAWKSPEEGAVLVSCALDELWGAVRGGYLGRARAEAAQVGAMALRFLSDLYADDSAQVSARDHRVLHQAREARGTVGPRGRSLVSIHEGFGYLKREFEALWSAVRFDDAAHDSAIHLAAIAVRFVAEITTETQAQESALR